MNLSERKSPAVPNLTWSESLLIKLYKCGPRPKYVGLIMDGYRRYGKKNKLTLYEAYYSGYTCIKNITKSAHLLDIKEMTMFLFSIENFKRGEEEINLLMEMINEILLRKKVKLMKYSIRCRFVGSLELLPLELQETCLTLTETTKHNSGLLLNICLAYTSTFEIFSAANRLCKAQHQEITVKDFSSSLLTDQSIYDPDILIRTSGEIRLSDFLLWQSNYSDFVFTNLLWPELSLVEFLKLIIESQLKKRFNYNAKILKSITSNILNNNMNLDLRRLLVAEN